MRYLVAADKRGVTGHCPRPRTYWVPNFIISDCRISELSKGQRRGVLHVFSVDVRSIYFPIFCKK